MTGTLSLPEVDLEVFGKYAGLSLPRHVSYPMPTGWADLGASDFVTMLEKGQDHKRDWSLYLHIPFCEALCRFCACNRVIVPKKYDNRWHEPTQDYVGALVSDLRRLAQIVHRSRQLRQVHWGGGGPTYLTPEMIEEIARAIVELFILADDAEVSMEIDPRHTTAELLGLLRELGFNRLSLGVQDFDHKSQEHVKRIQPFEMVRDVVQAARASGFRSINFDLIYGMPYQTVESMSRTIELTIELQPDRIAYYHYAQIPNKIATQRGMDHTKLPSSVVKLQMFLLGWKLFTDAGYAFIGLDHFAKPAEWLAQASDAGTLQRNFQGMTTAAGLDSIGVGVSAISHFLGRGFSQNLKEVDAYQACAGAGRWSAWRGKWLSTDDLVRQAVIQQIYCDAAVQPAVIEQRFGIDFGEYFQRELARLGILEEDGLVQLEPDGRIMITFPLGRVLMRNVAAVFDAYLNPEAYCKGDRDYFSANA